MIEFDKHGNPQPAGILKCEFDEFNTVFVESFKESATRTRIFEGYAKYIENFKKEIVDNFKDWVGGSYTTQKKDPNDIDIVNLVDYNDSLNGKEYLLNKFLTQGGSKENYLVDGYFVPIYAPDDPRFSLTEQWFDYWLKFFSHDRSNRPKAVIELSIV